MVQFDNQYRQVKVKIVYYGPALGGKTTCLQHIHRVTDPQRRSRLYSLNTASDRTLFFDLLSLNLGRIRGYRLTVQLYTVPGQVQYNATRRAVLAGVDGIVFVADSQSDRRQANIQSLANLHENLQANGFDPTTVPVVLQYNKRDLGNLVAVGDLDRDLNPARQPAFPSVAITGDGVMDAFAAITETTLVAVAERLGIGSATDAIERLRLQVRSALSPLMTSTESSSAGDVEVTVPDGDPDETGPLPTETLVSEAVRANLAMTDLGVRLEAVSRQLERKALVTAAIADFGRAITVQLDPAEVLRTLLKTAVAQLRAQAAAVLVVPVAGELREAVVHGFSADPMLAATADGGSLASQLAEAREPVLVAGDLEGDAIGAIRRAVEGAGFASAVAVPLLAQRRLLGLLTLYRHNDRPSFDDDERELATILGATAAMGYANALAFRQLEGVNTGLEPAVDQRSTELRIALDEVQRLNHDLERLDGVRRELVSTLTAQLQAPVASLLTAAQVLDRVRDAPPEKAARLVSVVKAEVARLAQVVDSAVMASELVGSLEPVVGRECRLESLLRDAVTPLRDLAKRLEVDIKILIPSGLETIVCDPKSLAMALRAVVRNGVEYNRPGGEVRVEVRRFRRDGLSSIEFAIVDAGPGIPDDDLPKIFDFFWQGTPPASEACRGIGLGLAIARQVAERHGGRVSAGRRDSSEGTQVTFVIPQEAAGSS